MDWAVCSRLSFDGSGSSSGSGVTLAETFADETFRDATIGTSGCSSSTATGLGEAGWLLKAAAIGFGVDVGFFAFFLRPMMGACTTSTSDLFSGISSSSICFLRSCLSFFACDLVFFLTGAVPTLPTIGGGELALEMEVEVIEAVSEINSLAGVPGKLTEAILACLDLSLSTVGIWGRDGADAAERGGGVSVFGVATTRNVLGGAVRLIGDPVAAAAGLGGTELAAVCGSERVLLV
jgi:hypothetical protein